MGLDMYLSKRTYVKNWDHLAPEERHTVTVSGPEAVHIKSERVSHVEEQVAYWRKANAIHKWFVDVCQDGIDDCRLAEVYAQNLTVLRDLCASLVAQHDTNPEEADSRAAAELPPCAGFFFGDTGIDEYYWADVRETADVLTELLNEPGDHSYIYQSSW